MVVHGASGPVAVPEAHGSERDDERIKTKKAMPALLTISLLGGLLLQGFNLVYQSIGDSLGMSSSAVLISTLPGVVLGVVCMLYGTLCDFLSPRRISLFGIVTLCAGGVIGFVGASNFWMIIIARIIQTIGGQVSASVLVVMAVTYLSARDRAIYIGLFNAVSYLSGAVGVLAGGLIASMDWRYLFLVPVASVVFIPWVVRDLPDRAKASKRIDYVGILLFGGFAAAGTIYFSFPSTTCALAIVVLFAAFALYVWKARDPFLNRSFIANGRYMGLVLLVALFFAFNYVRVPLYNVIGGVIYDLPLGQISVGIALLYVIATIVGCLSGPITNRIGRFWSVVSAAVLMIAGFIGCALFIRSGFWVLVAFGGLAIAGVTIVYTPLYSYISDVLPEKEHGRGVGVCDLVLYASASIGMSIYGNLMNDQRFASWSLFVHGTGTAASVVNMFWVIAGVCVVALAVYLLYEWWLSRGKEPISASSVA